MHSSYSKLAAFVHALQAMLIIAAMSLTIPRLSMDYQFKKKENLLALTIGAKSLVFIAYQILTEHTTWFSRWHSYRANAFMNCFEIVAWAAVTFFVFDSNVSKCTGVDCTLSWLVVALSVLIASSNIYTAIHSVRELRKHRAGRLPGKTAERLDDSELMVPAWTGYSKHNER
ncbi:hypothetical protein GT037_010618 [Alternaria burnsii]|uniref:MARVEL domain-containing protein n=1 Tax=Alternaria burnsii TaxID=1187904 RepID=A0A8H7AU11_9PLEO|nr:uncharacterized protein GT037_010618 [Alternaria burnsii]KAF7671293.1 hypothetical protein GT037_010618 [Alternaria burnsii]